MKTNIINVKTCSFVYRAAFAAILATSGIAHAQTTVTWDGGSSGTGTILANATNWTTDTLPTGSTVGIINTSIVTNLPTLTPGDMTGLRIQQDAGTVDRGATTAVFSNTIYTLNGGTFNGGVQIHSLTNNSSITVNGGTMDLERGIGSTGASSTANLTVTGGTLTTTTGRGIRGANSGGFVINVSGGSIAAGDLRMLNSSQQTTVTGGSISMIDATSSFTNGGRLTFGLGNGTVSFAGAPTIGGGSFVDFLTGSGGALSITGFTSANYASWWDSGFLRINGVAGSSGGFNSSDFVVNDATLTLVPEPSTWALLAVSLTTLAIFRRRRRH